MAWNETDLIVNLDPPEEDCAICAISLTEGGEVIQLSRCNHSFHGDCIRRWFSVRLSCPNCLRLYGIVTGTQPPGTMQYYLDQNNHCAGYPNDPVIVISYFFPSGIQGPEHPSPGSPYTGTRRYAFLPYNADGQEILRLFIIAWLLFSVGTSITTGRHNTVVWGGIHQKTNITGGPTNYGYPDPAYFSRVRLELASLGVE